MIITESEDKSMQELKKRIHAELLRTCDTYREIYFSQFPEERARYSSVSAGNIMKEVTV